MKREKKIRFGWGWGKVLKVGLTPLLLIVKSVDLASLLFVFFLVFLSSDISYCQLEAATPIHPSVISGITPWPTPSPHLLKPRKLKKSQVQSMGVSSAMASEKYVRKVILEFSKEQLSKLMKDAGESGYVDRIFQRASTPIYEGKSNYGFNFRVDQKGYVYLVFRHAIKVFDDVGNLLRTIKKTQNEDRVNVDEDGDLWIYSTTIPGTTIYGPQGRIIKIPTQRIYDPNGNLIASPDFKDWSVLRYAEISHGVIYSKKNGDVYFKIKGADEKNIPSYEIESKREKNKIKFPSVIDGFSYAGEIISDNAGNVYRKYWDTDDSAWPNPEIDHVYKFDSQGHLLAGFDFLPQYINTQTQAVYHWEFDHDYFRIVKWEKAKS